MKYQAIISQMSLEDKVALCSGADFFSTRSFKRLGVPGILMSDGPHGLRKQVTAGDHLGLNQSIPSTCFPTASLSACSWDRDLLFQMGAAIGKEALKEEVSVVLGPGINIKRNPFCGRNFEYFSEDPFLAGEMAVGWIKGIQSQGVGASLKHFAANNQENERMSSDSLVDERTLHEIYLPAFERAVKQAKPATVMCAYNKLNGIFCSDHSHLLRDILREDWGFEGVIVTDWGAMNDRVEAFKAGLDLEMPNSKGVFDQAVCTAVRNGMLSESRVDEAVDRILELVYSTTSNPNKGARYDVLQHHLLAKKIALQSAVLVKNEGQILPIKRDRRIALIGALASDPRYQGAGSSHINPPILSNIIDGLNAVGLEHNFFAGYHLDGHSDHALLDEAINGASSAEIAVIVAGLPAAYETEGLDRVSMQLPGNQNELIARVASQNPRTVVVLVGGAPVEMPWLPNVKAVLNMYLAGQAGGLAVGELLIGAENPSGKLAETYPLCYEDVPSAGYFGVNAKQAEYREGIYVGYRYYDAARKDVLFPFGHGLSYTSFSYHDLEISKSVLSAPYSLDVSLKVHNSGALDGAEVVQIYIGTPPGTYRARSNLVEFTKIYLKAGETKSVHFSLDARSFAIFDTKTHEWCVEGGMYLVKAGASSRDIRLQTEIRVDGQSMISNKGKLSAWYLNPLGHPTHDDFETLMEKRIEAVQAVRKGAYTLDCSFQDMHESLVIRLIIKIIQSVLQKGLGKVSKDDPTYILMASSAVSTPLKNLCLINPQNMSRNLMSGLVHLANGHFLKGIITFIQIKKE